MLEIKGKSIIDININGTIKSVMVRPADTLLHVIRNQLGLTGAKNGCENGDCDGCTVLVDDWPVKSCLMLAVEAIGHKIVTIEGLKNEPIQNAFVEKFAIQCGYCTPGMIMNCHGLIKNFPNATGKIIEEWLESNLCRCTGYHEIREAIKSVINR
ncbi:MAG: (2Fe-2S)-binding protein [Epulopiscium sp.]|nr:(2Fe-2S)-binding protein [Candidatus Epulonipiscium sp.]